MSTLSNIANIRKDYKLRSLLEKDAELDAIKQFDIWWQEAIKSNVEEVNAMTLATCNKNGKPSARIVLLKGFTQEGFIFFTNYESRKGEELKENNNAALVFFWKELERQIRIEGLVEKISEEESDKYYNSRPTASRIGAWASPQSETVIDRTIIENNFTEYEIKFGTDFIPRPSHWGGYLLKPTLLEFWQGRSSRLHDRIQYSSGQGGSWKMERLAP